MPESRWAARYPEMALENALKRLKKQYGPESVIHWRVSNTITVYNILAGVLICRHVSPYNPSLQM
jgi:hypothetical protein